MNERERRSATILWLRLAHVFQKINRISVAEMRCQGLSLAQFDILAQIGAHEGLSQQELADYLLVTKGNISQLVEKMEQRGLVRRSAEGRMMRLWLTEQGHALYAGCIPAHEELLARQFTSLSAVEQRQLRALLARLDHGL
ncbi:MAG: MarR family winged helix-turn-helix transcriptional regulator [Ktedonobacterales bacterium]